MAKKSGPALPKPVDIPTETLFTIRRTTMGLVAFGLFAAVTLGQPIRAVVFESNGINLPIADTSVSFAGFLAVGPLVMLAIWGYLQFNMQNVWRKPVPPNPPPWRVLGLYDQPFPALMGWLAQTALVQVLLFGFAFKATMYPWGIWLLVAAVVGSFLVALVAVYRRWPDPPQPWLGRGWRSPILRRGSLVVELVLLPGCLLYFGPLLDLGLVDLSDGKLERVEFQNYHLRGADFSRADMRNASLGGADLRNTALIETNLEGANLRRADLGEANLEKAKLQGANLIEANLAKAKLQSANLSEANLIEANLREANLEKANLLGADLFNANLVQANLQDARLQDANLQRAALTESVLAGADLFRAKLEGADLREARLFEANLEGAQIGGANLQKAVLSHAKLQGADLQEADLRETELQEADLSGAFLKEAKGLTREQICSANFDQATTFPDGSTGHSKQEVCIKGVVDEAFGLTPPGKEKSG